MLMLEWWRSGVEKDTMYLVSRGRKPITFRTPSQPPTPTLAEAGRLEETQVEYFSLPRAVGSVPVS